MEGYRLFSPIVGSNGTERRTNETHGNPTPLVWLPRRLSPTLSGRRPVPARTGARSTTEDATTNYQTVPPPIYRSLLATTPALEYHGGGLYLLRLSRGLRVRAKSSLALYLNASLTVPLGLMGQVTPPHRGEHHVHVLPITIPPGDDRDLLITISNPSGTDRILEKGTVIANIHFTSVYLGEVVDERPTLWPYASESEFDADHTRQRIIQEGRQVRAREQKELMNLVNQSNATPNNASLEEGFSNQFLMPPTDTSDESEGDWPPVRTPWKQLSSSHHDSDWAATDFLPEGWSQWV